VNAGKLLTARGLTKSYSRSGAEDVAGGARFAAVDGVDLDVYTGSTLAIVGESGCGKTTLARMLLRLIEPDAGEIQFGGRDLLRLSGEELRQFLDRRIGLRPKYKFAALNRLPLLNFVCFESERVRICYVCFAQVFHRNRDGHLAVARSKRDAFGVNVKIP